MTAGAAGFEYDLATLLAFNLNESNYQEILESWLAGYRSVRLLPEEDIRELPTFIICRLLIALGWLHTRKQTKMAIEYTGPLAEMSIDYARQYLKNGFRLN